MLTWVLVGAFLVDGGWETIVNGDKEGHPIVYKSGASCEVEKRQWEKQFDELVKDKKLDGYILQCVKRGDRSA